MSLMRVGDVRALPSLLRLLAGPTQKYDHRVFEQAIRDITISTTFEPA
jgi:hypothetical protein